MGNQAEQTKASKELGLRIKKIRLKSKIKLAYRLTRSVHGWVIPRKYVAATMPSSSLAADGITRLISYNNKHLRFPRYLPILLAK